MRQYIPVITLAAALALLLGVLLPSDNAVFAAAPVFDTDPAPGSRSVPENTPPGVNIGAPISATDPDEATEEFGNTLEYSLDGDDAASFAIDKLTGQLFTKAPLNFETESSYSVTVRVDDGESGTDATQTVGITVMDIDEPPAAPGAPTVVSFDDPNTPTDDESSTRLKVVWHAPKNTGPDIIGYEVEYKKSTETAFGTGVDQSGTDTVATITDLDVSTSYQVRVRATNGEADTTENWSFTGTGSTNKEDNGAPSFDESGDANAGNRLTRSVHENEPAREDIGGEVRANAHVDDNTLTYRLEGPDADLFNFDTTSGQISAKTSMNHEDPRCYVSNSDSDASDTNCFYYVTVAVFDGAGASDARPVRIEVRDRSEAPDAPARPIVRPTEKSSRSLDVSWKEPRNPGAPITGYDIRYRMGTSGEYRVIQDIDGTSTTIAPEDDSNTNDIDERLTPATSYEIHVMAKTDERDSSWSAVATGRTSAGNKDAIFDDRPDDEAAKAARTIDRAVNENTRAGQPVGTAVSARNRGGTLTYKLVEADAPNDGDVSKFAIDEGNGRILTKEPLNTEAVCSADDSGLTGGDQENCTYLVKVEVRDGLDEHGNKEAADAPAEDTLDDVITVRITVENLDEAPAAPTVTVTSPLVAAGATEATLMVTWNMPENTGPPITGYVVECTGAGITADNPCPQPDNPSLTAEEVSYTITGLTPKSSYRVRVRADNAEYDDANSSDRSRRGRVGKPNRPASLAI